MKLTIAQWAEGQVLPPVWFGYSHRDFEGAVAYFYPMPINFIVRMVIDLKSRWDCFRGRPSRIDIQISKGIREHMRRVGKTFELNVSEEVDRRIKQASYFIRQERKGDK